MTTQPPSPAAPSQIPAKAESKAEQRPIHSEAISQPSPAQRMYDKLAREMDAVTEQFTANSGDPEMWAYYLQLERMMKMAVQMLRLEAQQQKASSAAKTSPVRQQSTPAQSPATHAVLASTVQPARSIGSHEPAQAAPHASTPRPDSKTHQATDSSALPQTPRPLARAALMPTMPTRQATKPASPRPQNWVTN